MNTQQLSFQTKKQKRSSCVFSAPVFSSFALNIKFSRLVSYLLLLLVLLASQQSMAKSVSSQGSVPQILKLVGESQMSWMFWDLYSIRLLTESGSYQERVFPQRLEISYLRDIDKQDLLTATLQEWQKLGVEAKPQWQQQLQGIWPSVKTGDTLMFDVSANGQSRFYYNGKEIGSIEDVEFASAFLSIWLSPNTSEKELRLELIGDDDA